MTIGKIISYQLGLGGKINPSSKITVEMELLIATIY